MRLGETPHPAADLRVGERTVRVAGADVPNEVLVVHYPLAELHLFRAAVVLHLERDANLRPEDRSDPAQQIERDVIGLVMLDVADRRR
jgi:hypothetical protein